MAFFVRDYFGDLYPGGGDEYSKTAAVTLSVAILNQETADFVRTAPVEFSVAMGLSTGYGLIYFGYFPDYYWG